MALSAGLGAAGQTPTSIHTDAKVTLEKDGPGFKISSIALRCVATVPGLDAAKFSQIADETKKGCPVSKALAGTTITLEATLG
jgi:lipoyl-dependent peroxiredoxin